MSFAACLRLSFSGFRVRSTAVFLGRLRRKCIRPQAVFLDYACEAPAFAAASQSCTASVSRIREGRGNVPAGGYLLCSFSPPRYLSSVRLSSALEPVWAYLVPSWVMECYILENPKVDKLPEHPGVWEMTINAQTGEMMDHFDKSLYKRGDARYKGVVTWEDVK